MKTSAKKIIITGGAGFLGANLARHYLAEGQNVFLFDDCSRKGSEENLEWVAENGNATNLVIMEGDIRFPPKSLGKAIEEADAVFHFAAQVAVTKSVADPRHDFEVNAQGTLELLELIRTSKGKRPVLIYSSTNKVYGGMEDIEIIEGEDACSYRDFPKGIPEDRQLDFHSPYGCSKGCADQYVRDYARIYGIPTIVFRQSCIYGCRQFGIEDQGWVAWFVIAAVLGRPITIYGNGKQVRDLLFVDDLIAAMDLACVNIKDTTGKIYNIGGGPENAVSVIQLIEYLKKHVNPKLSVGFSEWRPGDQLVYISDIRKAKSDFGWQPNVNWVDGVKRLVTWVRENRELVNRMV
jgi:CDP-paratose 2-epimerase